MKINGTIILVFVLLALLAAYFLMQKGESDSMKQYTKERVFTLKNTDDIHKIFIAKKDGEPLLLTREKNGWMVNEKYPAVQQNVDQILQIFKDVQIKYVPSGPAAKNAIPVIASHGIKVQALDKDDNILRSFYIGGVTATETGTYFIMDGEENPFVMELPYFTGSLRARFDIPLANMRTKTIVKEKVSDIKKAVIRYPKQPLESFVLERSGDDRFSLSPVHKDRPNTGKRVNPNEVESYLLAFKHIAYEGILNEHPWLDSITSEVPFMEVDLYRNDDSHTKLKIWPREMAGLKGPHGALAMKGVTDRYFVYKDKVDFGQCQHNVLKNSFKAYSDFFQ